MKSSIFSTNVSPKAIFEELDFEEFKGDLQQIRTEVKSAIDAEPEASDPGIILLCVIENLLEGLKGLADFENLEKLDIHKQARIFADMNLFFQLTSEGMDEDDDEEFDFDFFDDEETENEK